MEEKKPIKISLGTMICVIIIMLLLFVIVGMFFYYRSTNNELLKTAQKAVNETKETMANEEKQNVAKKINKVDEEKDLVYTSLNKMTSGLGYSLPYINIKSDEVDKINKEIEEKYKGYFEIETYDLPYLGYKSYLNDNILSVLIEEMAPANDEMFYKVYNIDVYEGKTVDNSTLLANKNITESDFLAALKSAHKKGFEKVWGTKEEFRFGEETMKYYDDLLNKTISNKNYSIEDNQIFLGYNGKYNVVAKIYSPAGPTYYWHIVEMDI